MRDINLRGDKHAYNPGKLHFLHMFSVKINILMYFRKIYDKIMTLQKNIADESPEQKNVWFVFLGSQNKTGKIYGKINDD